MKKLCLSIIVFLSAILVYAQTAEAPATGDGSTGNPYQISTWENLYWISQNTSKWDKHYIQTADITFPQTINEWDNNQGWKPIGNIYTRFTGTYNGNNKTIDKLYIYRTEDEYVAFFAFADNASIRGVGLLNTLISGYMFTGGLVGSNNFSTLTHSYCEGNVIGHDFVGGLVGANQTSLIENCYTVANVAGDTTFGACAGGLVGINGNSSIFNSYSTGCVTGNLHVGGLAGINSTSSTINNCYSESNVTGDNIVGGLVGSNDHSSTINNSYSACDVTADDRAGGVAGNNTSSFISNCYSKGTVARKSGSNSEDIGGFVGNNDQGEIINCYSTDSVLYAGSANPTDKGFAGGVNMDGDYQMTGNYWDTQTSGQSSTAGDAEGRLSEEMKMDSTFINADWDFYSIWGLSDTINDAYPHLFWQSPVPRIKINSIEHHAIGSVNINGDLFYLGNPFPFQYGYCWNTNGDPSLNDDKIELGAADSIGVFHTTISELTTYTQYYIRAFAINDIDTFYSEVKIFTTFELPSVGSISITNIDSTSIMINAETTNLGYPLPSQHGFCWNTSGNPSLEDSNKKFGKLDSTGVFSTDINGLTSCTEYYIRAYIKNQAGTVYSDIISFTTLETNVDKMVPLTFGLSQNHPNPFNPATTIRYQLSADSEVELTIFDLAGRKITTLINDYQSARYHTVNWNASGFNSGVYFYRLKAGDFIDTKKMVFMK